VLKRFREHMHAVENATVKQLANDSVGEMMPFFYKMLLQMLDTVDLCVVNSSLQRAPNFIVDQIGILIVEWP